MKFENTLEFAQGLDKADPLKRFRDDFLIPTAGDSQVIYLCGNSLGLQPKQAKAEIQEQLDNWENLAVEGWFEGDTPWMFYHQELQRLSAPIVGARPEEVIPMNTLTVNLHLLMVSFFRPAGKRKKILMEAGAFPSDQYAVESQLRFHGLDPEKDIIEVNPKPGEYILSTEDIIAQIHKYGDEIALILFGGVNYFTGQYYDLPAITRAGHAAGAVVGFDLAHAAGNVPLRLNEWGVDFACWCSYKYMNSGPGGISGVFIHEKHFDEDLPRFAGWWGYDQSSRFKMAKGFIPQSGAQGWQISCSPVLAMAAHKASLRLFDEAGGVEILRKKSLVLTAYLEFMIEQVNEIAQEPVFKIITPREPESRGAQLSLIASGDGKGMFNELIRNNVRCDWREPNVIRISPAPFYNSFEDIYHLGRILTKIIASKNK